MNDNVKGMVTSKTFWVNVGAIVGAWSAYLSGAVTIDVAIATTVSSVTNIGLRRITSSPATFTGRA